MQKLQVPKEKLRDEMMKVLKNPLYADALSSLPSPLDSCQCLKQLWYHHFCHYHRYWQE